MYKYIICLFWLFLFLEGLYVNRCGTVISFYAVLKYGKNFENFACLHRFQNSITIKMKRLFIFYLLTISHLSQCSIHLLDSDSNLIWKLSLKTFPTSVSDASGTLSLMFCASTHITHSQINVTTKNYSWKL